jgi:hypothetical protein
MTLKNEIGQLGSLIIRRRKLELESFKNILVHKKKQLISY